LVGTRKFEGRQSAFVKHPTLITFVLVALTLARTGAAGEQVEPRRQVATTPAASPIARDVRATLRETGRARVFINMKAETLPAPTNPSGTAPWLSLRSRRDAYKALVQEACRGVEAKLDDSGGATVRYRFDWIPSLVVELHDERTLDMLEGLQEVASVHADLPGHGALLESSGYIRAPEARDLGYSGDGTLVAVLDSGLDMNHPSFEGAVLHTYRFLQQGSDTGPEPDKAEDGHGHGTNVAGIIASRGGLAPLGVAPGAELVIVKILDDNNAGWLSDWTSGVDHVISLKNEQGMPIDAINMSLASAKFYAGVCDESTPALANACRAAVESGILVLAASGNWSSGSTNPESPHGFMAIPGCYSATLSVGATLDVGPDTVAQFTYRSARLDLLAPGQSITSAGLFEPDSVIRDGLSTLTGTSQAAPHATAVACLLRAVDPTLSPADLKDVLQRSGRPFDESGTDYTVPILDARAAVEAVVVPRFEDLAFSLEAGRLVAAWTVGGAVERFEVRVLGGEQVIFAGLIPGGESRFELAVAAAPSYTFCIRSYDSQGLAGLEECATARREFLRGDCTNDGSFDISDAIFLLGVLFQAKGPPACSEACNSNTDDRLDLSDAIYALYYLFVGGPAPGAPFPGCGKDDGNDNTGCEASVCL
jgi:subtilisin family serine protease